MENVSKSQRKRDASSVQDLGEKLVTLTDAQINQLGLPEDLLNAVAQAKTINKRGARKRQMQYLGVLMRRIDTAPIQDALLNLEEGNRKQVELHKQAERWRDELLGGNDTVLDELLGKLPDEAREQLRALVAQAREERATSNPSPTPSRVLFRYLFQSAQRGSL